MVFGRKKPVPDGRIEKPEDRVWKEEFEAMTVEDHERALHQLGLDDEEIEEWEETVGYKEKRPEREEGLEQENQGRQSKQVKKQK